MKRITLFVTALLTAVVTMAQVPGEPKWITLTSEEQELVKQNNDFAFRLFKQARTNDKSMLLSPLSITCALGMLNNSAAGETQQQINQVLGFGEQGADAINNFCHKMLTETATLDEETKVLLANTIFMNSGRADHLQLRPAFVETVGNYYEATPQALDFTDAGSLDVINQWASDHTEGMIKEILKESEFRPDEICYLLNALYFKGAWAQKFDPEKTKKCYFDNGKTTADMMSQEGEFLYADNDIYQSIIMPYGNGAYQMTVFLPWQWYGRSFEGMIDYLNGENWNTVEYEDYQVSVEFPRFETETDQNLKDVMSALGMPKAFDDSSAEFPYLCYPNDDETIVKDDIFIELMKQVAKIKVSEEGTEASAVTVIGMYDNGEGPMDFREFIADHPFLYTISERSTGAILFIGQYMGDPLTNVRHDIELTDGEKELVASNNNFAFELFQKANMGEDLILSPLSITYALGMLNNGAAGQTQQEINQVLGFGEQGADAINNFCRKLLDEVGTLDAETRVSIANTIFMNQPYVLKPDFVEKANDYYDAQPETRDFHDGQTMDVINQWASDHTQGMITDVLDEQSFNPDAVSYLLNAIYFKGTWTDKFDKNQTQDEPFNGGADIPMMHRHDNIVYTDNDIYQAVRLPYGNEAYQMSIFLPREDKTTADVLAALKDGNGQWQLRTGEMEVDLKMPRFETETNQPLPEIMSALGMPSAFDPCCADFSGFCDLETYISSMRQVAKIKLDEEGTEAAAVTIIEVGESAVLEPQFKEFHANRPFLYIIFEQSTGVIFFIGQYAGVEGARTPDGISDAPRLNDKGQMKNDKCGVYDLQGRQITNAQLSKGLYIKDGRKVILP